MKNGKRIQYRTVNLRFTDAKPKGKPLTELRWQPTTTTPGAGTGSPTGKHNNQHKGQQQT